MATIHHLNDYRKPPLEPMQEVRLSMEYLKRREELRADTEAANAVRWREHRANLIAGSVTAIVMGGVLLGILLNCMPK